MTCYWQKKKKETQKGGSTRTTVLENGRGEKKGQG